MEELKLRKVLVPPPLLQRFFDRPDVAARLARVRQGMKVMELVETTKRRTRS